MHVHTGLRHIYEARRWIILIILAIFFAALGVLLLLAAAAQQYLLSRARAALSRLDHAVASLELEASRRFITPDRSHIIALDETGKRLAVGSLTAGSREETAAQLVTFDSILGAEIVEDALTLTKFSRTSRITSARPLLAREAAIPSLDAVQPASAQARKPAPVHELTLKIYLSSSDTPVLSIPFLPAGGGDAEYTQAFSEAQHVHELIREIVSA